MASYAVCDAKPSHFHVNEDVYAEYLYCILKSMIDVGHKNIYLIPHHQTEGAGLMPMTIVSHKAQEKLSWSIWKKSSARAGRVLLTMPLTMKILAAETILFRI